MPNTKILSSVLLFGVVKWYALKMLRSHFLRRMARICAVYDSCQTYIQLMFVCVLLRAENALENVNKWCDLDLRFLRERGRIVWQHVENQLSNIYENRKCNETKGYKSHLVGIIYRTRQDAFIERVDSVLFEN